MFVSKSKWLIEMGSSDDLCALKLMIQLHFKLLGKLKLNCPTRLSANWFEISENSAICANWRLLLLFPFAPKISKILHLGQNYLVFLLCHWCPQLIRLVEWRAFQSTLWPKKLKLKLPRTTLKGRFNGDGNENILLIRRSLLSNSHPEEEREDVSLL